MSAAAILLPALLASVGLLQAAQADTSTTTSVAASCTVTWSLPSLTCSAVSGLIVKQMEAWSGSECPSSCSTCCSYSVTQHTSELITGTHSVPVQLGSFPVNLVQDLTFTLVTPVGSEGCTVTAYSVQEMAFIVKDSGQDYCNLKNLMKGSGLTTVSGVVETVAGSSCTDLAEATC